MPNPYSSAMRGLRCVLLCLALTSTGRGQEIKTNGAPPANGQAKKCTNETPKGTYGFYGNGTFLPGNPDGEIAGPYTTVGLINFDGAGHFNVPSETETFNGQPAVDSPFNGTYTVNPDCTFIAANQFGAGFSDSIARSTISFTRSGARTSMSSANHHVRIGAWISGTKSGNAVRLATVVVPNLLASPKPSLIDER